jgi:hypothetical protein
MMKGSAEKTPVNPVFAALPVVCRTNHGTATIVNMLPTCEMALAVSSAAIGRRFVASAVIAAAFPFSAINPLFNRVGDDIDFVNSLMNYF